MKKNYRVTQKSGFWGIFRMSILVTKLLMVRSCNSMNTILVRLHTYSYRAYDTYGKCYNLERSKNTLVLNRTILCPKIPCANNPSYNF